MDSIKEDLDKLFENADSMHPDELLANFNTIMNVGDTALKKSGEYDNLFVMYYT